MPHSNMLVLNSLLLFLTFNFNLKEYQRKSKVEQVSNTIKPNLKESETLLASSITNLNRIERQNTRQDKKPNASRKNQHSKDIVTGAFSSDSSKQTSRKNSTTTKSGETMTEIGEITNEIDYSMERKKRAITELNSHINFTSDVCGPILGSCEFAKNKTRWLCSCDSQCVLFGDCCYDFVESNTTKGNENGFTYRFKCYSKRYSSSVNRFESSTDVQLGFLAVDSCPDGYKNQSVVHMCINGDVLDAGTYVISNDNVVFRNKLCAICNGVTNYDFFTLRIFIPDFSFDSMPTEQNGTSFDRFQQLGFYALSEGNLIYTVEPPRSEVLRGCLINLLDIEATNDSLCQNYINPVQIVKRIWRDRVFLRNMHCVDQIDENHKEVHCITFEMIEDENLKDFNNIFLMSVMFRFSDDENVDDCTVWSKKVADEGNCKNLDLYTNVREDIEISWIANSNLSIELLEQIAHFTPWLFSIKNVTLCDMLYFRIQEEGYIIEARLALKFVKTSFLHEVNELTESIKNRKVSLALNDNSNKQLAMLELRNGFQNISETKSYQNRFPKYDQSFLKANINIKIHSLSELSKRITVLSRYDNKNLIIDSILTDDLVDITYSIPDIVTYTCFSLSIMFLIILVITQRRRGLLNNISSINIENISISLLLSDVLFITGTRATNNTQTCYLIGCALHYLWLSFFTFITISVCYVTCSLRRLRDIRQERGSDFCKKRMKVTTIGLLIPVPLVLTSVVLDKFGPPIWSSGYSEKFCFPDRYPANLAFFSGPIALSLVVNLACLVGIICKVCAIRMETLHVRKFSLYKEAIMYLRLVIISGISWVTGIISSVYKEDWMEYVFTVSCALHGFFIAVSVLTTSRIRSDGSNTQNQDKTPKRTMSYTTDM